MEESINENENEKSEENIDKEEEEGKKKRILKDGIKTLIGTEIRRFTFGSLMTLQSLNPYIISYLRHCQVEKTLTLQYGYFFRLVHLLTLTVFGIFTPAIQKKVGLRFIILFGGIFDILFCLILYFSKNYYIYLFAQFINALAGSFGGLIGRNLMGYFFAIRGKLNGGLSVVASLVSSGYNILAEKYFVNPFSDEADVDSSFYTFDVSSNFLSLIKFIIIDLIIGTALALLLIVPHDKKIHGKGLFFKDNDFKKIKKRKKDIDKDDIDNAFKDNAALFPSKNNDDDNKDESKPINDNEDKESENENKKKKGITLLLIKKALRSKRILRLFLMGVFSTPLMSFLMNMWRPIAIRKGIPTIYQQNLNSIRPYVACASTLIFSWLSDSVPFKYLYSTLSFINTFVGIFFYFTLNSPILFMSILLLNAIASSGRMAITSPHYMKVFGLKYFIQLGGVIGLHRVIMSPLIYFFMYFFDQIFAPKGTQNISDIPYIILFITCGALNFIASVLGIFEPEDKFTLD
jgi:MFS family permease